MKEQGGERLRSEPAIYGFYASENGNKENDRFVNLIAHHENSASDKWLELAPLPSFDGYKLIGIIATFVDDVLCAGADEMKARLDGVTTVVAAGEMVKLTMGEPVLYTGKTITKFKDSESPHGFAIKLGQQHY